MIDQTHIKGAYTHHTLLTIQPNTFAMVNLKKKLLADCRRPRLIDETSDVMEALKNQSIRSVSLIKLEERIKLKIIFILSGF